MSNTFQKLVKYISKSSQIHFKIKTNTFQMEVKVEDMGDKGRRESPASHLRWKRAGNLYASKISYIFTFNLQGKKIKFC